MKSRDSWYCGEWEIDAWWIKEAVALVNERLTVPVSHVRIAEEQHPQQGLRVRCHHALVIARIGG